MEEIYFPEDKDPYLLAKNSIALKTLMHIRDEAHRFGITFHRSLREKAQIKRLFSHIKGIGEQTEIKLLQEYKTYENVKNASLEELTRVIGKRAEILYSYLHSMDKV
jgi:excinuclease ABC subunit C